MTNRAVQWHPGAALGLLLVGALASVPAQAKDDPADAVYRIPIGHAPVRGPETTRVTIVEYGDFQCPFCGRAERTLKQLADTYGDDVRFVFKENPLDFHEYAALAAEAALAANAQGKFWPMHDLLFQNQEHLTRDAIEGYARSLGLDMARFKADLDSDRYAAQIQADRDEADRFAARGTPQFFLNGRRIKGAQPYSVFKALVDREIVEANRKLADGTPPWQLYRALTANGLDRAQVAGPTYHPQQQGMRVAALHAKDFATAPAQGAASPIVTIVEWGDFQCPFCARATKTMDQLLQKYPKDVRVVFKHQPLSFHVNALPAAIASVAAQDQGKFWEFYVWAYTHQRDLGFDAYGKWAQDHGLDMARFYRDEADPATKARVEADMDQGTALGAKGTPTFFIDGRIVDGAEPLAVFKAIVDKEIDHADLILAEGTPRDEVYEKLLAYNLDHQAPATARKAGTDDDARPVNIVIGNAPVLGAKDARVTIVEFGDFQCPFCGRAVPTLHALLKKYDGKVRLVWMNQPLPFHPNAFPAARAAMAAQMQGKFWEMYEKLFANQRDLSAANYLKWAAELGLDLDRFKNDMATKEVDDMIKTDAFQGKTIGAVGTPTFFINGRRLVGAQPEEKFEEMIDEELKK